MKLLCLRCRHFRKILTGRGENNQSRGINDDALIAHVFPSLYATGQIPILRTDTCGEYWFVPYDRSNFAELVGIGSANKSKTIMVCIPFFCYKMRNNFVQRLVCSSY